jgi:hypothetical protein
MRVGENGSTMNGTEFARQWNKLCIRKDIRNKLRRIAGGIMVDECVVAVYDNLNRAQDAVHILDRGGFPAPQISLVTKGSCKQPDACKDVQLGDDSVRDAAIGAGLGAITGVLGGIAMAIASGATVIFLLGPIGIGLTGAAVGAFLGGMGGWGVHSQRIAHYQTIVEQGQTLVIVHGNPLEIIEADRILKETEPTEIHINTKTESEAPEVNPPEHIEA